MTSSRDAYREGPITDEFANCCEHGVAIDEGCPDCIDQDVRNQLEDRRAAEGSWR